MLETIKQFFISIAGVITSLVNFVIGFISDIVSVVKMTGSFFAKIPRLFSWLPPEVLTIIIITFSVVVIYKVMGREG